MAQPDNGRIHTVVLGASAGGIEALRRLIAELPADFPAAVCVVLHLSPHGPTVLPQILARAGALPAVQAEDGMPALGGRIHVAPPNCHLRVEDGRLRLDSGPHVNGHRPAVDVLFESAADAYGAATAGVVLSGVLDDGTAGLMAIKRRGGLTLAQDAIENVAPDHVGTAAELGQVLARAASAPADPPLSPAAAQTGEPTGLPSPECAAAVMRAAFDEAREGLLALDEHGTITHANVAAGALLGHDRGRLAGKPLAALIDMEDRSSFRSLLLRLPKARAGAVEIGLNGRRYHLTLRSVPQLTPYAIVGSLSEEEQRHVESQVHRFACAAVSIDRDLRVLASNAAARALFGRDAVRRGEPFTGGPFGELRPLATRLAALAAPLRSTVVQAADGRVLRVGGLAATATDDAILLVDDVSNEREHDRVMREFLRNAAHQLRTPLAGIMAATETLQQGAKSHPAELDRFLAHIQTHATRLSRIARGLLTLARTETGDTPTIDLVEVGPLLHEIADAAEPRDGVAVRASCPPGVAALAVPDLLHEAVAALVENAIAHTHEGAIVIRGDGDNGVVRVTVADSGPGILPEFQDRVFEPFFRVGAAGEGFGLGLAIAAGAVRAMRGEIDVSSSPGRGTTFTVTLPSATASR